MQMRERSVAVLGSTGSIGRQTLEVVAELGYRVVGLMAGRNARLLEEQIRLFQPDWAVLSEGEFSESAGSTARAVGRDAVDYYSQQHGADVVVAAISGVAGLLPTWNAVQSGATVALANKESLVTAGSLMLRAAEASGATILPVDSEHSAIWQCLQGIQPGQLSRLILTASGGPFRDWSWEQLQRATVADALKHPTWSMGSKITVDSATLMNKGLEVIEAHWLFNVGYDQISVVVHPESIVHSLIELVDGSCLAQLSTPDMRLPIQLALTYPERLATPWPRLDLVRQRSLTFFSPRAEAFPCLNLAINAGKAGGSYPIALNAANEVAVDAFLRGRLSFAGIPALVERVLEQHTAVEPTSIAEVISLDQHGRQEAEGFLPS